MEFFCGESSNISVACRSPREGALHLQLLLVSMEDILLHFADCRRRCGNRGGQTLSNLLPPPAVPAAAHLGALLSEMRSDSKAAVALLCGEAPSAPV